MKLSLNVAAGIQKRSCVFRKIIITAFLLPVFLQLSGCGCVRNPPPVPVEPGVYLGSIFEKEGNSGSKTMKMPVDIFPMRDREIRVSYEILAYADVDLSQMNDLKGATPDEAVSGDDYVLVGSGTLVIPEGDMRATIDFDVKTDKLYEHDEVVIVRLTDAETDIRIHTNVAVIVNDDPPPVASIVADSQADLVETADATLATRTLKISLSEPSGIETRLSLATTALPGFEAAIFRGDYTLYKDEIADANQIFSNHIVTIPIGGQEKVYKLVIVDDGVDEGVESIRLALGSFSDDVAIHGTDNDVNILIPEHTESGSGMAKLNDTGLREHFVFGSGLDSVQDDSYGQDSTQGGDDTDGVAGFRFTKLDANGNPLANQAVVWNNDNPDSQWKCVKDEATGLMWEVKRPVIGGFDSFTNTITWYDPDPGSNGGDSVRLEIANEDCNGLDCNTMYFAAQRNLEKLCGKTGWRVPNIEELRSLAFYGAFESAGSTVAIDANYFPGNRSDLYFWSSTTVAGNVERAFAMSYDPVLNERNDAKDRGINAVRLVNDQ